MNPTENPSDCNTVTACYTPKPNHDRLLQKSVTAQNFCYSNSYPVTPTTPTQGEKCNNTHRYVTPPPQPQKTQTVTPVTPCNPVTGGIC